MEELIEARVCRLRERGGMLIERSRPYSIDHNRRTVYGRTRNTPFKSDGSKF
jgi:hypothetical protein